MARGRLSEMAYTTIKRDILRCVLAPGSAVSDVELAKRYGMSKTPVREALNVLRVEGLVEVVPRRGTFVAPVDLRRIQDTFMLRLWLEPHAAAQAATTGTAEAIQHVLDVDAARETLIAQGTVSREDLLAYNREFHVAIAQASGIVRLGSIIAGLHEETERFYNSERLSMINDTTDSRHGRLAAAIAERDGDRARDYAAEGIQHARENLVRTLIGNAAVD